jgi:F-type H+-transporting ATPase subunit epsilon
VAKTKFRAEVLTPEGQVFDDEVEMVSTRTAVGSIGILANHAPLMAILEPTELRLYRSESDVVRLAQGEGPGVARAGRGGLAGARARGAQHPAPRGVPRDRRRVVAGLSRT